MAGQQCFCSSQAPKPTKDKSTCACCVNNNTSSKSNQTNKSGRAGKNKFQTKCPKCKSPGKPGPANKPDKNNRPCKSFKPCICTRSRNNSKPKFCKCANKKSSSGKKTGRRSSKSKDKKEKVSCCTTIKKKPDRKCKCPNAPKRRKVVEKPGKKRSFNPNADDELVCTCSGKTDSRNTPSRKTSSRNINSRKKKREETKCTCKPKKVKQKKCTCSAKSEPRRTVKKHDCSVKGTSFCTCK